MSHKCFKVCHACVCVFTGMFATTPAAAQSASFVNWESPQSHPIDITPDGFTVVAVNTPDAQLEIFNTTNGGLTYRGAIAVGLDPVSVRVSSNSEAWVVNQISDSISVVDLQTMRVTRTLNIGDEPADVVFGGSPQRAYITLAQSSRLVVIDPANLSAASTSIALQGAQPRALAVSPDGSKIYAAIFESGNHSVIIPRAQVSAINGPYGGLNPPPNAGTLFSPARTAGQPTAPKVAHIARKNAAGQWMDGNNRNWSSLITWDVNDHDIAVINSNTLSVTYINGLMNIVAGLAVSPSGTLLAVGQESRNELRFETGVNGIFIKAVGAFLASGATTGVAVDLNPHLTYTSPTTTMQNRLQSIGDPRGVAWSPTGATAYVTGLGSNNVIAVSSSGARLATIVVGEGPTGIVVTSSGSRLFVLNRFENSISTVDTASATEISRVMLHDATPLRVKAGRKFIFDTHLTSGLGQASCASCHIDGRSDRIAWDIGSTNGAVIAFDGTCVDGVSCANWHPMKGPLVTQTLVGIIGTEPFHWRGEKHNLSEFNVAFVNLQGLEAQISAADMASMSDYVESLTFGPQPNRNLDGTVKTSLAIIGGVVVGAGGTGNPSTGQTLFTTMDVLPNAPGGNTRCVDCHPGVIGSSQEIGIPLGVVQQNRKMAPLREVYRKTGASITSTTANRGFGFNHDSEFMTIQDLLSIGFNWGTGTTATQRRRDIEAFLLSFGTDTHAGIGAQAFASNGGGTGDDTARITQLIAIASSQSAQVGLIAKGIRDGVARGWMLQGGAFVSDLAGESISPTLLLAGATAGNELTYTLVPAGAALRLGIDRDLDGALDQDEIRAGTDPATFPCASDFDGDFTVGSSDLSYMLLNFGMVMPGEPTDLDNSGYVDNSDISYLLLDWGSCQ